MFFSLEHGGVLHIARVFMDELIERMTVREIDLEVDDEVIKKLAHHVFDPVYREVARPTRSD